MYIQLDEQAFAENRLVVVEPIENPIVEYVTGYFAQEATDLAKENEGNTIQESLNDFLRNGGIAAGKTDLMFTQKAIDFACKHPDAITELLNGYIEEFADDLESGLAEVFDTEEEFSFAHLAQWAFEYVTGLIAFEVDNLQDTL